MLALVGTLIGASLVYCLVAPKEYVASGEIEFRGAPESLLATDRNEPSASAAALGQLQLETLANALRSEQLAWDVITRLKLYEKPAFARSFQRRFRDFRPDRVSKDAEEYLLRRFDRRLTVESLPHTLVLSIRFRSRDPELSAAVVNALIEEYERRERDSRLQASAGRAEWLGTQLEEMKKRVDQDVLRLADFQRTNGIVTASARAGAVADVAQNGVMTEIEEANRALANATAERIGREAEYEAVRKGDPELAVSAERALSSGNPQMSLLQQLRARRSDLELEEARLEIEHGPNFPRVVEIRTELRDTDLQIKETHAKLVESLRSAWKTSVAREALLRKNVNEVTGAGLKLSGAALSYESMWQEANTNRETYLALLQRSEEAKVAMGSRGSTIRVIDYARVPAKPDSPNALLDLTITAFVSMWLAVVAVLAIESLRKRNLPTAAISILIAIGASLSQAQAPTPNTSGLPAGVAHSPQTMDLRMMPNAKDAPDVWKTGRAGGASAGTPPGPEHSAVVMAAPIGPGDLLEVTEGHGTDLRENVRVSEAGTVVLPLAGEVDVRGLDERSAAHAIEKALIVNGMLRRPQVKVLVTAYAGQDVSVLGEVVRPGVYSFTVHHKLLDLISLASGLSPNAGRLVSITHRSDPEKPEAVVLDPSGIDPGGKHNPELEAGDTVQVGRAGLVYVVGDVIRPGGFPVDPVQAITVVQAISLAWGPTQNASLKEAVLIREQPGGRTVTTLNLKRMLRGKDPDLPVRDRDILFVPNSMAKNLINRSLESVVQSAVGVSIYSGLVYSQRY
ncbi:polysaccharide biosynthesis/export family protein [Occallatibacter savannae]|uniref:polysaccharide biosynthesis/export family protein n=1 Tax=Occallatibacter savannae TaxID=1002691 RepID=UPI0013A576B8|nr:polysaccharide biosynthesis/export family protein [Occallatibacter savannae]